MFVIAIIFSHPWLDLYSLPFLSLLYGLSFILLLYINYRFKWIFNLIPILCGNGLMIFFPFVAVLLAKVF